MANFGIIRDLCTSKRITINELAQRIGKDVSTIQSMIRRGTTYTSTLEEVSKALGVSPGVFFGEIEDKEKTAMAREIEHLKELIKEKERLIEVLMSERKV